MNLLANKLYPEQQQAVEKFRNIDNCLVADELGLGKTVTGIAIDAMRRESQPPGFKTLVVCPLTGVLDAWVDHFTSWRPDLKVRGINPKKRNLLFTQDADVYVVHWESLAITPALHDIAWNHIIADEAHRAKNRNTKRSKALKQLKTDYKTALTGTPMDNRPDDLWSILNWLYPKKYSSYWRYFHHFVDFYEDINPSTGIKFKKVLGPKNTELLHKQLEPIYIRRLKKDFVNLPETYRTTYTVDLHPQQRKAYDEMKKEMIAWLESHGNEEPLIAPVVIAQLSRLQQFALGYCEIHTGPGGETKVKLTKPSSKLNQILDILDDSNEKMVIFSRSSQFIRLLAAELDKDRYSMVYGGTPYYSRRAEIKRFIEDPNKQAFLATIGAAGVGLDGLQHACSTVLFADREWKPSANEQAEGRLHRRGQKEAVQIIDVVARKTVDQRKATRLQMKKEWIMEVIGA